MGKNIFIDPGVVETRIAITENDIVTDLFIYRDMADNCLGNIYAGKVVNVLPGMGAAFVDIGAEKNAYLSEDDLIGLYISEARKGCDVLHEGREIIVQVTKEPSGSKGAKITMNVTLPGKQAVYLPFLDTLGVSNKISDTDKADELRKLGERVKAEGAGIIIRTSAKDAGHEDIERDINYLEGLWKEISKSAEAGNVPRCLYDDSDPSVKIIRELLNDDIEKLYINSQPLYDKIYGMLSSTQPAYKNKLSYYSKEYDMFDFFNVSKEIEKALSRKVWLKSGGYLIFDSTEALNVIDVNSGKYIGKREFDETIVNINLEAADEIARQIRLRNLGGIIIIDFIDMVREEDKEKILSKLEQELSRDRTPSVVVGITKLGLVEMTRKKTSPSLGLLLLDECSGCGGAGRRVNAGSIFAKIERHIKQVKNINSREKVNIKMNTETAALVGNNGRIAEIGSYYDVDIMIDTDDRIPFGEFYL